MRVSHRRWSRHCKSSASPIAPLIRTTARKKWPAHLAGIKQFAEWLLGKTDFDTFTEEHARLAYEDEQEIIRTGQPRLANSKM